MKPNGYVQIDKCNLCTLAATAVVYLEMEYNDVLNSKNLAVAEFTASRTPNRVRVLYDIVRKSDIALQNIPKMKELAEKYLQVSVNSDTLDIVEVSIEDYLFLKEWNKKT